MAITQTQLTMQGGAWLRAWTIIATLDADTTFAFVPEAAPAGLAATTPVVVILTPLSAAGLLSTWIVSTLTFPLTAAGWELTKSAAVGSGAVAAQLLVQMIGGPPVRLAHP